MTFEEFFIKKRIDLTQLSKADPELVSEFKSHFVQMGEKSFDHSKKFWFNKLRKDFHLKEEPKLIKKPVKETSLASQADYFFILIYEFFIKHLLLLKLLNGNIHKIRKCAADYLKCIRLLF